MQNIGLVEKTTVKAFSEPYIYSVFEAKEYISWRLKAHGKAGVQAPFLFRLCNEVLESQDNIPEGKRIEQIRAELLTDECTIDITDLGAGAKTEKSNKRKVSYVARTSGKAKKWAEVLHRLVRYFQPQHVIELGTSLGISGMYLASAIPGGKLYTLEGCPNIAALALGNFKKAGISNAEIIVGNFDDTLSGILERIRNVEFAYIDGNHTEEATLRYFYMLKEHASPKTVLVFDDIHWSEGMKRAWRIITEDDAVTVSVDLFRYGIVFFNTDLSKQHFNLTI